MIEAVVVTWNLCAGTNPACPLFRATGPEMARAVAAVVPRDAGVVFLQESCTGGDAALRGQLEAATGRAWVVRSVGLTRPDGSPYRCHPDLLGRDRGTQAVTVAVADPAARFATYRLSSPPWSAVRYALCATAPVRACTSHLSSGLSWDDHQPGAPYRNKQVRELMAAAGPRAVVGGDLNLRPHSLAAVYQGRQECDPRRRATHEGGNKLDYLFAPKGTVRGCRVVRGAPSDHRPLVLRTAP
ncbi:MAG: hypothetical protein HOY71_03065 [Nonomuraea sp.]|nr:hypothetical protein [Nonomuraea sp.]